MVGYRSARSAGTQCSMSNAERIRAENARRQAVANRCRGRKRSTASNPLPHVYQDMGGDVMGCKHCPLVRQLTDAEYHARYGVHRPPPRQAQQRRALPLWPLPAIILGVIAWAGQSANSAPPIIAAGAGMLVVLFVWVRR